ncbi:hypothetical protein IGI04_007269, partial [Brassica rapa subsp. trilocularis]
FALFTPQVHIIHENAINFFFFKNDIFTLSPSSSSSNYKIVIVINTLTTMNNQFEALNAPKNDLPFFFLHSYELNTTYLSLSLHIKLKTPNGSRLENFLEVEISLEDFQEVQTTEMEVVWKTSSKSSTALYIRRLTGKSSQKSSRSEKPADQIQN